MTSGKLLCLPVPGSLFVSWGNRTHLAESQGGFRDNRYLQSAQLGGRGLAEKLLEEGQLPRITAPLPEPGTGRVGRAGREQE